MTPIVTPPSVKKVTVTVELEDGTIVTAASSDETHQIDDNGIRIDTDVTRDRWMLNSPAKCQRSVMVRWTEQWVEP